MTIPTYSNFPKLFKIISCRYILLFIPGVLLRERLIPTIQIHFFKYISTFETIENY